MYENDNAHLSIPLAGKAAIWRIFGKGESPLTPRTTFELIDPIIRSRIRTEDRDLVIAEIADCFEIHGEQRWLKNDMRVPIAVLILDGVRDAMSYPNAITGQDTAFWSIGSIDPDIAAPIIRSIWSVAEHTAFAGYALDILEYLSEKDNVLDARRITRIDATGGKVSVKDVLRDRRLDTLRGLAGSFYYLYPGVVKVIQLLVDLHPNNFYALVDRIDHPYLQVMAADVMEQKHGSENGCAPSQWITGTASNDLVRLSIVRTFEKVNELDWEVRRHSGSTEEDEETAGASLLNDLVDRLSLVKPLKRAGRLFELLDYAGRALNADRSGEKPRRVQQAHQLCVDHLVRLVSECWSDELLVKLRAGLALSTLSPLTRPLADVAWELRNSQPERSAEIVGLILDLLEQQIARAVSGEERLYYSPTEWRQRDWIIGLGVALALSDKNLDYLEWLTESCRDLPLSAWDLEEDLESFFAADRIAQFRFLVALFAIQVRAKLGSAVDPKSVRDLTGKLWLHCHFTNSEARNLPQDFDTAEYASRVTTDFGDPSDVWILEQAKNSVISLRTLWALVDQRISNAINAPETRTKPSGAILQALSNIVAERFVDIHGLNLHELVYLARLWLLLGESKQDEKIAMAIIAYRGPRVDRTHKILALKLLALGTQQGGMDRSRTTLIDRLYQELWATTYVPHEELADRREVDDLLADNA